MAPTVWIFGCRGVGFEWSPRVGGRPKTETAGRSHAALDDVRPQPCQSDHRQRLLRRRDGHIPVGLCGRHHGTHDPGTAVEIISAEDSRYYRVKS
jgi:hypothetical protein